jgi:hypothetical protein
MIKISSRKRCATLGYVLAVVFGIGVTNPSAAERSADIIYADPSAAGPVLELLSRDHRIADLATLPTSFTFKPVLIGPAALDNPATMALVIHAYQAGLTVGIVQATQAQADEFDGLVENGQVASCKPADGDSTMALYALRHSLGEPAEQSRYCMPDFVTHAERDHRKHRKERNEHVPKWLDESTQRKWLDERFASTPPPVPEETYITSSDSLNLDSLAGKIHCSELVDTFYGQIQQDVYVTSLRSFNQSQDYFYVNNYPQFLPFRGSEYSFSTSLARPIPVDGNTNDLLGTRLLFTEPDTTIAYVSEYTNSKSETVSGGAGFSFSIPPSFDVEGSYSVTVGTETTSTIPPVTILNSPNLSTAIPQWNFFPASFPQALYSPATAHVWLIPRSVYEQVFPNGENIGQLLFFYDSVMQIDSVNTVRLGGQCALPTPFPTWTVTNPTITGVEPASVRRGGGSFEIVGTQLYPSIVSSVLLGGDQLPAANVVPLDDSHVKVVVPSGVKVGLNPVQVNTFFNGTTLPSNADVQVDIRP